MNDNVDKIDISFMDIQGVTGLTDSANKMAGLVTKAAMGAFLAYFSLNELLIELRTYRNSASIKEGIHGTSNSK